MNKINLLKKRIEGQRKHNYDEYNRGMYNGLVVALAIIENQKIAELLLYCDCERQDVPYPLTKTNGDIIVSPIFCSMPSTLQP